MSAGARLVAVSAALSAAPTAASAQTEVTAPGPAAGPVLELDAALRTGLTSNLQRARTGGETDGLVDLDAGLFGAAWHERLTGALGVGLRQPLGLPALRAFEARVDVAVEQPAGPVAVGAAVVGEVERALTVFTESGTLSSARQRSALGVRLAPFVAWAFEPFRLEFSPMAGARQVRGAEQYDLGDLGVRLDARWFDTPLFHVGLDLAWQARRFEGLYARTRDGLQPSVAPAVSLSVLDAGLRLGSHPHEAAELALRLALGRTYDRFDGYHGHVRLGAGVEGSFLPETGLGARAEARLARRTYAVRVTSTAQSGDETEVEAGAGVQYVVRPWLVPTVDGEVRFAEAAGRGTLFTESVGLLGLRGRY